MNDELWRVQLSTGEIRMMTIDALDRAFDEGLIDARVPVLPPGASAWTTLGEAAGLEDCPTEQSPSLSPLAISSPAPSSTATPDATTAGEETSSSLEDLPDSFDELAPRRRRGLVIGGAVGVGALALAATVALLAGNLGSSVPAADVKAATAVEAPPPAVETLPPPVAKEAASDKQGLSDWQKRMLLDADKAREDKARAKNQERADKAGQQPPKKKQTKSNAGGLLNGGDRFDPLNGAL